MKSNISSELLLTIEKLLSHGQVTKYWPYRKAEIGHVIIRAEYDDKFKNLLCAKVNKQPDNFQTFQVELEGGFWPIFVQLADGKVYIGTIIKELS